MSSDIESWPPPDDANAFESLCLDLWKEIWNDPSTQKNGRSGQPQAGVDVFGKREGKQIGVQSKQKDGLLRSKLTVTELEQEVEEAKSFRPALSTFVIATTGPRDARVQERARLLTEDHKSKGLFSVEVWSWKDIWHELYQREDLLNRIGPIYWRHSHRLALQGKSPSAHTRKVGWTLRLGLLVALVVTIAVLLNSNRNSSKLIVATIETIEGLPEGVNNDPNLRSHRLTVRNPSDKAILNFRSRLQLPEPIYSTVETNTPVGTIISWQPRLDRISIAGSGDRSLVGARSAIHYLTPTDWFFQKDAHGQLFKASRNGDLTGVWELTLDKLPPRRAASILFLTSNEGAATNYITLATTEFKTNGAAIASTVQGTTTGAVIIHDLSFTAIFASTNETNLGTNELRFSFEGEYDRAPDGKPRKQHFLMPIRFNAEERRISSLRAQGDNGRWRRVIIDFN